MPFSAEGHVSIVTIEAALARISAEGAPGIVTVVGPASVVTIELAPTDTGGGGGGLAGQPIGLLLALTYAS